MPGEDENQGGGAGDEGKEGAGDAGKGEQGAGKGNEGKGDDHVTRADHDRALADMQKYKRENEKLRAEKADEKSAKLKEEKRFEELAAAKEQEAKEAREEADKVRNSFLGEKKFNTVRSAAEKLGLRPEAVSDLETLDLSTIQIETTSTGKINVLGADKFAERLKTLKPHWFAPKQTQKVNTNGTRVLDTDGGEITTRMIMEAEAAGKKAGNMAAYQEMVKKYQQQRVAKR